MPIGNFKFSQVVTLIANAVPDVASVGADIWSPSPRNVVLDFANDFSSSKKGIRNSLHSHGMDTILQ